LRLFFALLAALSTMACMATAQFHSKTGRAFPPLTHQAVRCDEGEVTTVTAAGGEPIGTISGQGTSWQSTQDDIADKVAVVAAKSGGTHVLLTERGLDSFQVVNPGQESTECARDRALVQCQTTYVPPTTSTYVKPTAQFVVFRVPRENWEKLPLGLRPALAAR
jgi:hypothetical protein